MFSINGQKERKAQSEEQKEKRKFVNSWVIQHMSKLVGPQLLNAAVLDCMEVECNEPGCAPLEVMIIIGFPDFSVDGYRAVPNKWAGKILKPIMEVTIEDVMSLDIPIRCLNSKLVGLDTAINSILGSLVTETVIDSEQDLLITDTKKLLQTALKSIEQIENDAKSNTKESTAIGMDVDSVTPVFMSSTIDPTVIMAPSTHSRILSEVEKQSKISVSSKLPIPPASTVSKASDFIVVKEGSKRNLPSSSRHEKGTRPRGCPCCDPDNLDNIIDKMLFMDMPPI